MASASCSVVAKRSSNALQRTCRRPENLGTVAPIPEYPVEELDRAIAVDVRGVWLGFEYAIPELAKRGGGSIVVLSSRTRRARFAGWPSVSLGAPKGDEGRHDHAVDAGETNELDAALDSFALDRRLTRSRSVPTWSR